MARPQRIRLGDLLIQESLLTAEQLTLALADQKDSGRKLGRIFVDRGWVTEVQIAKSLARQLGMPFVDLGGVQIGPELAALLPEARARRLRALPLQAGRDGLRVAMADPADLMAYDELTRLLKRDIDVSVAAETQLLLAIDRAYGSGNEIAGLAQELTSELTSVEGEVGALLGLNQVATEDAPVVRLLASVFEEALSARASDIHIEPQEKSLRIRFRIDGALHVKTEADAKIAGAVALRLKLIAGLDIAEKRLPQDGRFNVRLKSAGLDVRISTMPTQYGESVVMRLLSQSGGLLSLDRLALPAPMAAALARALARPSGMILVTGPTGSGKTTTLYAALNELNDSGRKIITVEDPVEYRLPGLNQVQVMDKIELGFERVLRAALRQDPDVILVGEMRDKATAETGMRAAMTGHLVLSTLHTNDAASTPLRLLDMGVARFMVAMSLNLVVAQRLVRLVCQHCAEPYQPDAQEAEWLAQELGRNLADHRFQHGRGCAECRQTGYFGRTGVYEFLELRSELVDTLAHGEPAAFAGIAQRQMAGETLRRDAVRLATLGRTTVAEARQVSAQTDE